MVKKVGKQPPSKQVRLMRPVELLHRFLTETLCEDVFKKVRGAERQRAWTLHHLVQFWTAVVLRAPKSLTQLLEAASRGSDPELPRVEASPQAFFAKCQNLSWTFFQAVFGGFTERLVRGAPARFAGPHAGVLSRFGGVWIVDGSRLDAIAHRLKILWDERAVVLPGCLLALYDLGHGIVRHLEFEPDAAAGEQVRAVKALKKAPAGTLIVGDRLYGNGKFFRELASLGLYGLVRRSRAMTLKKLQTALPRPWRDGTYIDALVEAGGATGPAIQLRWIRWQRGTRSCEILTNVLDHKLLPAEEALALYRSRWTVERMFLALKSVLNMNCFYAGNTNAVAMQVYASAIVYNAMRFTQGEVAAQVGIPAEEISEARLFPRVAVASSMATGAEVGIQAVIDMNPGVPIRRPDLADMPFATVSLDSILVRRRSDKRRKRKFCKARRQWKSLARLRGAKK